MSKNGLIYRTLIEIFYRNIIPWSQYEMIFTNLKKQPFNKIL